MKQLCSLILALGLLGCPSDPPEVFTNVWPPNSGLIQVESIDTGTFSLQAVPETGWQFDHWNGPVADPGSNQTTIEISQDQLCQAVFKSDEPIFGEGTRIIGFAGFDWTVRRSDLPTTPGVNYFSDSSEAVWVDEQGLHLTLTWQEGKWWCSEVILNACLGYGTYTFKTRGRVDQLDPNLVLGIFTWDPGASEQYHRELDIEFSRWGNPINEIGQYVVQPCDASAECPDQYQRFNLELTDETIDLVHVIVWQNESVEFLTYYTKPGTDGSEIGKLACRWKYSGEFVPKPGLENIRFNLWLVDGNPPQNGLGEELIITDFSWQHP
ncbi:MAG: hypothetical protein WCW26_03590 [Candidatus Buchananbacteria bacterium]